jgi:hypothetical protein
MAKATHEDSSLLLKDNDINDEEDGVRATCLNVSAPEGCLRKSMIAAWKEVRKRKRKRSHD